MNTILITGGNGFLGQHLIKALSEEKEECQIKVICRNKHDSYYYYDIHSFPNVEVIYGIDISKYDIIEPHFNGINTVFNLAGMVSFNRRDKQKLININVEGTSNVLQACKVNKVKRLIHVSSTAALGFSKQIIDENYKFEWNNEDRKNKYSYSKHLGEKIIENEIENEMENRRESDIKSEIKIKTIIVNPSLIMGPVDTINSLKLISSINNKLVPFNPPGSNSIVDVRDVAKALVFLMKKEEASGKYILNSASLSFKDLNNIIARELKVPEINKILPHYSYRWLLLG